jgi:hypothetical protein
MQANDPTRQNRGRKAAKRRVEIRPLSYHLGFKPKLEFVASNLVVGEAVPTLELGLLCLIDLTAELQCHARRARRYRATKKASSR